MTTKERKYPINILGDVYELTLAELRWILTREAYDLYFQVHYQKGTITFGEGALCSDSFLEDMAF